jgi:MFS family permease
MRTACCKGIFRLLGLVLGAGAIGGVLGALTTKRLSARFGTGRLYTASCLVFTAPLTLVPLAGGPKLWAW